MATIIIYTYMCTNLECRHIEKQSGVRQSMITCPECGRQMRLIDEERVD